jgi:hypothetical protein
MGLLAPELVVYCAWIQWSNARELSRSIARANYPRKHPWTLAHSFFAGMGGFAVDSGDFVSGQDYLYLTTAGVRRVVELGHTLPDLRKEAIFDKSKADSLGKILVCLQAGYMVFQVIGRLAARLPITLLEVNTLGHVLCALTMYAFWFQKPLCVSDPVVLSEDWARPLLCLWFMKDDQVRAMQDLSSQMDQVEHYRELDLLMLFAHPERREPVEKHFKDSLGDLGNTPEARPESELSPQTQRSEDGAALEDVRNNTEVKYGLNTSIQAHPIIQQDLPDDLQNLVHNRVLFYKRSDSSQIPSDEDILQRLGSSKLWDGLTHVYHCDKEEQMEAWWECWSRQVAPVVNVQELPSRFGTEKMVSPFKTDGVSAFIPQHIFLDSDGLKRWELACRGLEFDLDGRYSESGSFTRRVKNWPRSKTGLLSHLVAPFYTMAVVTALYGALHALCWHSHFPSVAEKMLWRTSSVVIAAGPVTGYAGFYVWDKVEGWLLGYDLLDYLWDSMGIIAIVLGLLVYVSSRFFILIEAFISIRSLPEGAYQTPNWTSWLPHL